MQILVRGRVGVEPRRGRRDDLAVELAEDGRSRAVAPVDRHGVRADRVRVGELAVERDRVSLVGGRLRQAQVGRGELRGDFVHGDARRRIANLAILVGHRADDRIILGLNPGWIVQVGMGCRERVLARGQGDRGRRGAVAPVDRDRIGVDPAGAHDRSAHADRAPLDDARRRQHQPGRREVGRRVADGERSSARRRSRRRGRSGSRRSCKTRRPGWSCSRAGRKRRRTRPGGSTTVSADPSPQLIEAVRAADGLASMNVPLTITESYEAVA